VFKLIQQLVACGASVANLSAVFVSNQDKQVGACHALDPYS
jgi:hypothetical protein